MVKILHGKRAIFESRIYKEEQAKKISVLNLFSVDFAGIGIDINVLMIHNIGMKTKKKTKGLLLLKDDNESGEIDFELDYLLSLSIAERFRLMENKSMEMNYLLEQNGYGRTAEIIKRK